MYTFRHIFHGILINVNKPFHLLVSDLHNTCKKWRFTTIKGTQLGSHCPDTCLSLSLFQRCFVMVFRWNCPSLRPRYAWLWGKIDDRSRSILNKLECNFSNFHRKKRSPRLKRPRGRRVKAPLLQTSRTVEWRFDWRNKGLPIIYLADLNFNDILLTESDLHMYCRFTTWLSLNATYQIFNK